MTTAGHTHTRTHRVLVAPAETVIKRMYVTTSNDYSVPLVSPMSRLCLHFVLTHKALSCALALTLVQSCMSTNTYNYYIKWLGYACTSIQYFTEHTLHAVVLLVHHEYRYMNTQCHNIVVLVHTPHNTKGIQYEKGGHYL